MGRMAGEVAREGEALFARARGGAIATSEGLPAPVARWLARAVGDPARPVRTAHLRHGGSFRTSLDGRWAPIRGEQYFTADPPAFLWWGRIRVAPGVFVDGRDGSSDGVGRMRIDLWSLLRLADARGPDLDQGALVRLLGEMFWLPTALADARYVRWQAVDDRSAKATLSVAGRTAEGTFDFGEDDLPTTFRAMRMRAAGKESVLTPFEGTCHDHRLAGGLMVPHHVRGAWIVDGVRHEYVRFDIERIDYGY